MAFFSIKGKVADVKAPVDVTRTEVDNLPHSDGDPQFSPVATLDELYWTGSQILGRKIINPRDVPTDGTQLIVAATPVRENCNFTRSLGLFVSQAEERYLLALPMYPINNASDCKLWQGAVHFQVDHVLSREALELKLKK
ncbi:MAG TPA: hypothetical protein VE954_15900 [Oligoflexus sp.]|uniref:hypothetical protein n=1 Tax=Oligoflexus sp. TaxID=1971216 RepID=UPI002D4237B4|nr:hypothetical protein [Oligoflexus sp.]HYX34583.1 hypothetical protein [Oligoflexus sp.]